MESKEINFDCQKAYESLQCVIANHALFSNDHLTIQIDLREDESISSKQYNRVLAIIEQINEIILLDLSEARVYYNLLKTRNDIEFNKNSENEILKIRGGEIDK